MDFMKLNDGTKIPIEEGAALDCIVHIAANEEAAVDICSLITQENLKHVEFGYDEDEAVGSYNDLVAVYPPARSTLQDGRVRVDICLREKTDVEKRLDALEDSQELQNEVLDTLIMEG